MTGIKSISRKLETVETVDLHRYSGKWYEIASYSQRFRKRSYGKTAVYTLTDKGYFTVESSWNKESLSGKPAYLKGKAFVVKDSGNAKFKMQFFWPFWSAFWIIELAEDYSCAVVSRPDKNDLWILSRTPKMNHEDYQLIVARVKENGFDPKRLEITPQK